MLGGNPPGPAYGICTTCTPPLDLAYRQDNLHPQSVLSVVGWLVCSKSISARLSEDQAHAMHNCTARQVLRFPCCMAHAYMPICAETYSRVFCIVDIDTFEYCDYKVPKQSGTRSSYTLFQNLEQASSLSHSGFAAGD